VDGIILLTGLTTEWEPFTITVTNRARAWRPRIKRRLASEGTAPVNHPLHGWPRLSQWLRNAFRIDRLFSPSRPAKKKRGCDLKVEELEIRWLPTTVEFAVGFYPTTLTSPISVLVELNTASTATITVDYATADGTALAGTDYTAVSGVLTFAPGASIQSFNVSLLGTNTNPRDFTLSLSSPSGATLGSPDTELVLLDPPTVQFPTIDFYVNEDGGYGTVTVTLSAASPLSTGVDYATSDYTARAGLNYTAESGGLTFSPGQTSATFTVPVNDFALPVFDTLVNLTLSLPTAGATISGGAAYLNIQSDEGGQPNYPYPAKPLVAAGPSAMLGLDPASGNLTADCGCGSGTLIPNGKEGMGANNQIAYVEGVPAFVYTSASEEPRPIISAYFPSSAGDPLPTDIKLRLTFNGTAGSWITYATTGHSAGDQYLLAAQPVMPATTTGRYAFTLEMQAEYSSHPTLDLTVSGNVNIVVNGVGLLGGGDPYGNGVSISGVDQLVSVTGGVLWVYGAGGSAYFSGTSGTLLNASDAGTLVKNIGGTYTYTRGGMVWSFDSSGYLISIATPGGGQTRTYTYAAGRISTIDEPDGFFYSFTYATTMGQTQLASVALLGGRTVTVGINSSNELTGITNPAGDARTFAYDPTTKRMSSDDAVALRTFTYDTVAGKMSNVNYGNSDTWGVVPALVKALQPTAIKGADGTGDFEDPLGNHTTYGIDGYARAVERTDPDGFGQSWALNKFGDITKTVDALGNETDYTYAPGTDNVTGALFPDGSRVSLTYDSFNKPITITDQLGNLTTITRDGTTGSALSIANPLGESEAFTFTSDRVQTITDALGHVTTVLYNSSGWMQTVIDPAGNRTTYGYDLAGNVSTTTTPDGAVGTVLYDADRRPIGTTAPGAGASTSTYNSQGLLATQVDPTGHTVTSLYNAQGWRTAVVDIYGHSTTAAYDVAGRQISSIDVYGNNTTYVNDNMGRVSAVVDPYGHGATTTYDADSNVTSVTDIYGNETQFAYDSMNRQVAVVDAYGGRKRGQRTFT
jgi:YD repeat-containing protein